MTLTNPDQLIQVFEETVWPYTHYKLHQSVQNGHEMIRMAIIYHAFFSNYILSLITDEWSQLPNKV